VDEIVCVENPCPKSGTWGTQRVVWVELVSGEVEQAEANE